jgi:LacI family transcriptional regulator, repressor for deo operon, udp, cdd, tsx, nupC, and nupG
MSETPDPGPVRTPRPSGRPPGASTLEDVARVAGVSVATVSRALRNLPNVAVETRTKVKAAAADLNYRADPSAARLATGRSNAIGIAMPFVGQWYFAQVLAGVEAVLASAGYDLLLYSAATPEDRRRFLTDALPVRQRVDGVVLIDLIVPPEEIGAWSASGVRLVSVGQRVDPFPSVTLDNEAAARLAVEHLIGLGHRRIGLIGASEPDSDDDPFHFKVPGARQQGYRDALTAAGIRIDPALELPAPFEWEAGQRAAEQLLGLDDPPTALFATSDEMAIGAMAAARSLGLAVPHDVSIIGFDDHDLARATDLTTIRQPAVEIGGWAVNLLLKELATDVVEPDHVDVPFELLVRGSTTARSR